MTNTMLHVTERSTIWIKIREPLVNLGPLGLIFLNSFSKSQSILNWDIVSHFIYLISRLCRNQRKSKETGKKRWKATATQRFLRNAWLIRRKSSLIINTYFVFINSIFVDHWRWVTADFKMGFYLRWPELEDPWAEAEAEPAKRPLPARWLFSRGLKFPPAAPRFSKRLPSRCPSRAPVGGEPL